MDLPNLDRIVETHVPLASVKPDPYFAALRRDVAPHLRDLQSRGQLRWFAFLLHSRQQLSPPESGEGYIVHLRLESALDISPEELCTALPAHFENPHPVPRLGPIADFGDAAFTDRDQAYGWKLFGETSEWVLNLLEDCEGVPGPQLTFQFLHYATNPLLLGLQSCHVPTRIGF